MEVPARQMFPDLLAPGQFEAVPTKSSAPLGTALMGSTSMIIGEAVAPTSPAEAPPASTARGGVPTLASATGGEATLPQLLLVAE
jgi:hypothetical protein